MKASASPLALGAARGGVGPGSDQALEFGQARVLHVPAGEAIAEFTVVPGAGV